jgi:hypothetical protein
MAILEKSMLLCSWLSLYTLFSWVGSFNLSNDDMNTTDWYGLYSDGWRGEIVKEAFVHPAKYARGLIRHIYRHLIDEGWLHEGDTVLDPFGGVALGGLDAMRHGLHWVGIELEQRFVDLGNQNIELWNSRYEGKLPHWGTARLFQGDSRNLVDIVGVSAYGGELTAAEYPRSVAGILPRLPAVMP